MAKYIDADALVKNFCGYDLTKCKKYGNETTKQRDISYSTMMLYEIADEIENMPAADVEPVRKWIPVEEKRPEDGQVVNVITKSKNGYYGLDIAIYKQTGENGAFCTAAENNDLEIYGLHVTHWTPVPDFPPKMDGGSE